MLSAIFSTVCSADRVLIRIAAAAWLCAASPVALAAVGSRIAVFPPVDRTGRSASVEQVQTALESSLSARGFAPIPRTDLDEFFRRHRIRYVGGISDETARAIGAETQADGVLLTSVDDWENADPPRFALTSRWVAAAPGASVAWMDTSAYHGQERPGAFGLGLVTSVDVLIPRASEAIAESLATFARTGKVEDRARVPRRFRPGSFAVDPDWAAAAVSGRPPRVAVLPFVVDAAQRYVGEVLASVVVRWLLATGKLEVLEPGVVREALLDARVIQEDGPSLPQVDALRALLDLDLIVSGRVTDYEAMGSSPGSPFVGFSARAIDVRTRQVVWSSFSFGRGDDHVGPFGVARIRSSITLTSDLVQGAVEAFDEALQSRRPPQGAAGKKEDNQ
jgi:hypothetical protein